MLHITNVCYMYITLSLSHTHTHTHTHTILPHSFKVTAGSDVNNSTAF